MKALVVFFSLSIIVLSVKAWPTFKRSFERYPNTFNVHTISDCMHVTSESGDYVFKKLPQIHQIFSAANRKHNQPNTAVDSIIPSLVDAAEMHVAAIDGGGGVGVGVGIGNGITATDENAMQVCGLYVIGEPDTIIEITMKHYDANCDTGALMAFVDGWELNGEYFPGLKDHHRLLEDRVVEFCNNYKEWPRAPKKKFFRSSQNAALLQYRLPVKGSFIANVRFHKISQPCNVLVQDTLAFYSLANYGHARNCTISALFPAVVSLANLKIGSKAIRQDKVNYDCSLYDDHLEIGGSAGLDSTAMEKSSEVCGYAETPGPEQGIFCDVTTVRLLSTGRYQNQASIIIRKADVTDLDLATLICT